MKQQELKKEIRDAMLVAMHEIAANSQGGFYAAGLASEGYAGGYRDALMDIALLMNGTRPNRRNYWDRDDQRRVQAIGRIKP